MIPVIADDIDPRMLEVMLNPPPGIRLLFAGPDETLVNTLRREFGLALPDLHVVLSAARGGRLLLIVPMTVDTHGLLLYFRPAGGGDWTVDPMALGRAAFRFPAWKAQAVIDALESLLFRRVLPTRRIQ